jgi:hypothetical protein
LRESFRRAIRMFLVGLMAFVMGAAAEPAVAAEPTSRIMSMSLLGCLESTTTGEVFRRSCDPTSPRQRWDISNGRFTKNLGTQECLTGEGTFTRGSIHTAPCNDTDPRQLFRYVPVRGSASCTTPALGQVCWYQRKAYVDQNNVFHEAECVSIPRSQADRFLIGARCTNENDSLMYWKVLPWS